MIRCFLTTVDNPYSPYEQFEDWYRFDTDKGYNSSGLLMRMAYTSDQLTDAENAYEIEQAIKAMREYGGVEDGDESENIY